MISISKRPGRWAIGLCAVGAMALPFVAITGASATPEKSSTLTVEKQVGGSPAPGTTFTEHVVCENSNYYTDIDTTVVFDEHGAPLTQSSFDVEEGDTCTVTETVTGGAIVTYYECDYSDTIQFLQQVRPSIDSSAGCSDSGPSDTPLSVTFSRYCTAEATITVTNGFVNFPPDPGPNGTPNTIPPPAPFPGSQPVTPVTPAQPTTKPAAAVAAAPLRVSPAFTG